VHNVSDVRQIEEHTAEPLVPDPSRLEFAIAIAKLKKYKSAGSDQIPTELIQAGGEILLDSLAVFLLLVLFCRCYGNREYGNSYLSEISSTLFHVFQQIDDCRRTHNYDEFICTFLSMLAQQGKLADLVQQHLVQHKKPGLPLPRVQRCVCYVLSNKLTKMIMLPSCIW
jgi:hypothetical protein